MSNYQLFHCIRLGILMFSKMCHYRCNGGNVIFLKLRTNMVICVICSVIMATTISCGRVDKEQAFQDKNSETGSVSFQIVLAELDDNAAYRGTKSFSNCHDINKVTAMIMDGDQTMVGQTWDCSEGNGTITGISPGVRNIIVQGVYVDTNGGRTVMYQGRKFDILIQAGVTTNAGTIECQLLPQAPINDADQDGDGFTPNENDCDDTNDAIHPAAADLCGDGIDQDCNPQSCAIQLPGLANLTQAEAENAILSIEMTVGTITQDCSDSVPFGSVIGHDPISGIQVHYGAAINLVISTGTCPLVCQGNQDPEMDCTACLPGYGDNDNDCGTLVRYVDADNLGNTSIDGLTWETALPSVQDAIDLCEGALPADDPSAICEVWVAEGRYYIYRTATHNSVRPRPGVHVYGGFSGSESSRIQRDWANRPTTLSALSSSGSPDHVSHVVTCEQECLIDGFIVSDAIGCMDDGGGMINMEGSTSVVRNIIFRANKIECYSGGGLHCAANSQTYLTHCRFENNEAEYAGGLSVFSGAVFSAENCVFENNFAWGGGGAAYVTGATALFSHCQFNANTGSPGAAVEVVQSSVIFSNSTFNDNLVKGYITARGGTVSCDNTEAVIDNCGFVNNETGSYYDNVRAGSAIYSIGAIGLIDITSSYFYGNTVNAGTGSAHGGAIYVLDNQNTNLTNCTFINNSANANSTANATGGAIYIENSPSTVVNSIIRGNIPDQIYSSNPTAAISHSNVTGIYTGDNGLYNIDKPVFFVDETQGNLHLFPYNPSNSSERNPCIDSANGDHAPSLDHDGNPRVDDLQTPNTGMGSPGYADMGAFEYQPE